MCVCLQHSPNNSYCHLFSEITGNPNIGFKEEDLEGEFDPEKFDKAMQSAFDDEFYGIEEDTEKPVFSDSEGDGMRGREGDGMRGDGMRGREGDGMRGRDEEMVLRGA